MIDVNDKRDKLLEMIHYLERFVEFHKVAPIHLIDATNHLSEMKFFYDSLNLNSKSVYIAKKIWECRRCRRQYTGHEKPKKCLFCIGEMKLIDKHSQSLKSKSVQIASQGGNNENS